MDEERLTMTNGDSIKYLTQDEARRLLAAASTSKRDRALFLLAYRHGLRASEIGLPFPAWLVPTLPFPALARGGGVETSSNSTTK